MVNNCIKIYAVRDLKGLIYDVPFFARNDLFAGRRFITDVRAGVEKGSMLFNFKEDFELHLLGEFNVEDGKMDILPDPVVIVTGKEIENA